MGCRQGFRAGHAGVRGAVFNRQPESASTRYSRPCRLLPRVLEHEHAPRSRVRTLGPHPYVRINNDAAVMVRHPLDQSDQHPGNLSTDDAGVPSLSSSPPSPGTVTSTSRKVHQATDGTREWTRGFPAGFDHGHHDRSELRLRRADASRTRPVPYATEAVKHYYPLRHPSPNATYSRSRCPQAAIRCGC